MPGEVREDANCSGDTLTVQSARDQQYQFPEILGDQIPTPLPRAACCDVRIGQA